jgi:predicted nuclease of restriction endonuclease-like (RecB) superfamily
MKSKQDSTTITIKDKQYREWLNDLKQKIRQSQIKAAVRVNSALIELYWNLGVEIVAKQAESVWGSGIIKQRQLDAKLHSEKLQQLVGEIPWGHHIVIIAVLF